MVQCNFYTLVILTISLSSYIPNTIPTFTPTPYYNSRSRSLLLKRKIADSNSHPQVLSDIHDLPGCPGEICGTLAGDAVQPLLAGAAECAQQDMADKMIDIAKSQLQDENVRKKLIELAKIYRQAERNTFPDYSSPSTPDTNSLFCQKEPKNSELNGLIQAQSKTADPNLFFDPKFNARIRPFGQSKEGLNSTSEAPDTRDNGKQQKTPDTGDNGRQQQTPDTGDNGRQQADTSDAKTNPETGNLEPETEATKSVPDAKNAKTSPSKNSSGLVTQDDEGRRGQDQGTNADTDNHDSVVILPNSQSNPRKSKIRIGRCRLKNRA